MSQASDAANNAADTAGQPRKRDLYLLLALNVVSHIQYIGVRFTALLFAVKLQASPAVMGGLIAVSSLVPALSSVQLGKMLDHVPRLRTPMLAASLVMLLSMMTPWFWQSVTALFVMCAVNGASYSVLRITAQQLIGRISRADDRAQNYSHYTMGLALGNVVAPLVSGIAVDHVGVRNVFLIFAAVGLAPAAALFFKWLRLPASAGHADAETPHGAPQKNDGDKARHGSSWDLLRIASLRRVLIAGIVLMTAWDVFSFLLPLYGSQLQFSASQIGMCASAFYAGTFFIRLWLRPLLRAYTPWQLLLLSMAGGSIGFMVYPVLDNFTLMIVLGFVLGSGIGLTQPMTMSLAYEEAPPNRKGEVIGLRLTLSHILQIVIPLLSGALGSALGLEAAYWVAAGVLIVGAWTARREWSRGKRGPGPDAAQ